MPRGRVAHRSLRSVTTRTSLGDFEIDDEGFVTNVDEETAKKLCDGRYGNTFIDMSAVPDDSPLSDSDDEPVRSSRKKAPAKKRKAAAKKAPAKKRATSKKKTS